MPKAHNIGTQRYVQLLDFPVVWGTKLAVRGWTQEIEEPFRTAEPVIFRLPFHKALAFGRWTGQAEDEEAALTRAIERRDVTYDDFVEEKGWTPAPTIEVGEEGIDDFDSRPGDVGGKRAFRDWERNHWLDEV
jgi:hypothetical protein